MHDLTHRDVANIVIGCIAILGLVIVLFMVAAWMRRQVTSKESKSSDGFTLGDLRALRQSGKMSDEEFEKARKLIVATHTPSKMDPPPDEYLPP